MYDFHLPLCRSIKLYIPMKSAADTPLERVGRHSHQKVETRPGFEHTWITRIDGPKEHRKLAVSAL